MIPRAELNDLVDALLRKTEAGASIWTRANADELTVRLASSTIVVGRKASDPSSYFVAIEAADGSEIDRAEANPTTESYDAIANLFHRAADTTVLDFVKRARQQVEALGTPQIIEIGGDIVGNLAGSLVPKRADVQQVINKIKGDWDLDYTRGRERVHIDDYGNYFANPTPEKLKELPSFRLSILALSPDFMRIEMRKDEPNGTPRQIELLTIAPEAMTGYAKHDQHKLKYIRRR